MQKPESNIITKTENTELSGESLSLDCIAKRLRQRESEIQSFRRQAIGNALKAIEKALEQGADLKLVRGALKVDGLWLEWLAANCPSISKSSAYNYMRAHDRFPTVGSCPLDCQTLTQLYIGVGIIPPREESLSGPKSVESPPVYGWIDRTLAWVENHSEDRDAIKDRFEPLAKSLWPERFA